MTARKRAIRSDLKKVDRHRITAAEYRDAPEIADDQLAGAKVTRPRGRPRLGDKAKTVVTIRLDADVVSIYRATGAGWQSRMNADLAKSAKRRLAKA